MIKDYFGLVKFAHTVFALPFAMLSFTFAVVVCHGSFSWLLLGQVVLCMVFARNTAMGFNRWADRQIDAANPRTASREIPSGKISPRSALGFVIINAALFMITASTINLLTGVLSPLVVAILLFYSYCKRFTAMAHLVLGLCLGIAPAGAFISVTGTLTVVPCLISLLVMTWCAGFDVIYALQDVEFDRKQGLHSLPAVLGEKRALELSILLHVVSAVAMCAFACYCPSNVLVWAAVALFCLIMFAEHVLVTPKRKSRIAIAFGTLNGLASVAACSLLILGIVLG